MTVDVQCLPAAVGGLQKQSEELMSRALWHAHAPQARKKNMTARLTPCMRITWQSRVGLELVKIFFNQNITKFGCYRLI